MVSKIWLQADYDYFKGIIINTVNFATMKIVKLPERRTMHVGSLFILI